MYKIKCLKELLKKFGTKKLLCRHTNPLFSTFQYRSFYQEFDPNLKFHTLWKLKQIL